MDRPNVCRQILVITVPTADVAGPVSRNLIKTGTVQSDTIRLIIDRNFI